MNCGLMAPWSSGIARRARSTRWSSAARWPTGSSNTVVPKKRSGQNARPTATVRGRNGRGRCQGMRALSARVGAGRRAVPASIHHVARIPAAQGAAHRRGSRSTGDPEMNRMRISELTEQNARLKNEVRRALKHYDLRGDMPPGEVAADMAEILRTVVEEPAHD